MFSLWSTHFRIGSFSICLLSFSYQFSQSRVRIFIFLLLNLNIIINNKIKKIICYMVEDTKRLLTFDGFSSVWICLAFLPAFIKPINCHACVMVSPLHRYYDHCDEWQPVNEYSGSGNTALYTVAVFSSVKFLDFGTYCQNLWPDSVTLQIPDRWNSIDLVIENSKRDATLPFGYELGWTSFLASGTPQLDFKEENSEKRLSKNFFSVLENWRFLENHQFKPFLPSARPPPLGVLYKKL